MKLLQRLLLVNVLCCCVPQAASLSFDYNFSAPGVLAGADLKYMNNSVPAVDRIDLTITTNWSNGRVAHRQPVRLWNDDTGVVASFTTNFTFAIKPFNNSKPGDGMAFFVAPYPASMLQDAPGGFLALFNNFGNTSNVFPPTVGVEFDTFWNDLWDPRGSGTHMGIDVNDIRSKEYVALPDGSLKGTMSAWVRYDGGARRLSATLRFDDRPELGLYNVNASVDLRASSLPQDAAVGFSAATGENIERHQILAWSFMSTLVSNTTESKKKMKNRDLIAGLVSAGSFIVASIVAWLCYLQYLKRKDIIRMQQEASEDAEDFLGEGMDSEFKKGTGPHKFSYSQLSEATRGFSDTEKLGEGAFGAVYRGFLQDHGLLVAIKRISKTSRQGRKEYISEVTIISRLRHRNLVQLIGWCHEGDELLLVYELMTNGNLHTHLHSATNTLTWPVRYKIILGMGSALIYLHQEWEQCVVHRDIKPSNVMLDASFNAKLGDFGLARLVDHSRGAHTTLFAGTLGYMDPECAATSRASTETDVYSFGVVLLEISCGRKPAVRLQEDECWVRIAQWVWEHYGRGAVLEAADARLHGGFDAREMEHALVVGLWCVHPDYGVRPTVRQAMNVLQFDAPLPELPLEMPVPVYAPPAYGYRYTDTSTTRSTSSGGGQSLRSDSTVQCSGLSEMSHGLGTHSFVTADTDVATTRQHSPVHTGQDLRSLVQVSNTG